MKRKKIMALILALSLLGTGIAGCGSNADTQATDTPTVSTQAQTQEVSTEVQTETQQETDKESVSIESTSFPLPTQAEDAGIYVEPIPDISDDFIRGMDVSSILVEEKSGVKYYSADGKEQDVFTTMAQAGINYARIRVWNDPYNEEGKGYGGGNNDVATAIELGKRATANGMKVCIDFHYSDFWADPSKQMVPKAWEGMSLEEKSNALYEFTKDSLSQMLDAGVNVCMVQVGNETNNGMSGETLIPNIAQLMNSGSKAIREVAESYGKDIKVALHYTNASDAAGIDSIMYKLSTFQVDYDIFALSYYPFWHGSFENVKAVMENIQEKYGKETVIAETSYCYTLDDTDNSGGNSVGADDLIEGYGATIQSQSTALRDVCATANEAGALGVFYWEGAWIAVGPADADNSAIWEEYGSGWASSYASKYDPNDAGKYYGGCSWDNQALFGPDGMPLESLNTYKWLKYGTNAEPAIDMVTAPTVACNVNAELVLPETVDVVYNNRSLNTSLPVEWNEEQVSSIDTSVAGTYEITGNVIAQNSDAEPVSVTCTVNVDLLNYVQNPSFEDADTSMWNVTYEGDKNPTDYQQKGPDAHTGEYSFHFWSESDMSFAIEQEFADLESGVYSLKAFFQGGDIDSNAEMEIYSISGDNEQTASFTAEGYANWQEPAIPDIEVTDGTLKIGVRIKCNAKGWGTIDDIILNKVS